MDDCRFCINVFLHFRALLESISEATNIVAENYVVMGRQRNCPGDTMLSGGGGIGSGASVSSGGTSQMSLASSFEGGEDSGGCFRFRVQDVCDEEIMSIGELGDRKTLGTEVNLEGKTIFRCFPLSEFSRNTEEPSRRGRARSSSGSSTKSSSMNADVMDGKPIGEELYLVVDTRMLYLCSPEEGSNGGEVTRVVCHVPMRNISASAVDGLWMHLSLKHAGDGRNIIKEGLGEYQRKERGRKGERKDASKAKTRLNPKSLARQQNPVKTLNLALCFDTSETASIVREMMEKLRGIQKKRSVEIIDACLRKGYECGGLGGSALH